MHSAGLITFPLQETSIQADVQLDISAQDNNQLHAQRRPNNISISGNFTPG